MEMITIMEGMIIIILSIDLVLILVWVITNVISEPVKAFCIKCYSIGIIILIIHRLQELVLDLIR
jgi:hypothetical protein